MEGEKLVINEDIRRSAKKITDKILPGVKRTKKYVITVAGESGSGKTSLTFYLAKLLNDLEIKTLVIQQDDYFTYPPATNFKLRRENLARVGVNEVRMSLLQRHVNRFKDKKTKKFVKPLVFFPEDKIWEETILCEDVRVLLVEGTYVSILKNVNKKIFINRTYNQTFEGRIKRKREEEDAFSGQILKIEHKIIREHAQKNDIMVYKDFSVH